MLFPDIGDPVPPGGGLVSDRGLRVPVLGQCQQRVDVDLVLVQLSVPGVGGGLPVVGGRLAPIRPLFPVLDLVGLRAGQVPDPTLEG